MALSGDARRQEIRDSRLVEAVRAGDARAFELLHERHRAAILSFCRHLTGRLEDAEDAVQHTFLSAYREITGGARELDLKPWLFTVARNRCLSLLRARRLREGPAAGALRTGRHGAPEERPVEAWRTEGLAEEVERREELRALVADLGELPEPQRAALVLSELDALSHAQIAQVLRVDTAKVRSLVFQARSSLISTRDARDTTCGEIRVQLATLRGSSLRRRTLRRHVRACVGCREFEDAVRVQRRDLALILPVAAVGLRDAAVPSALTGGAAGGGAAGGGGAAAAGGAAIAGSGVGVGGGGVLGGLAAAVAGSGVAQFTAVVAVAAAGSVGVATTDVPQRLGIADGPRVERLAGAPASGAPADGIASAPAAPGSDNAAPGSDNAAHDTGKHAEDGHSAANPDGDAAGHRRANAPGQLKKNSAEGSMPPGLIKKDGGVPPGQARRDGGGVPPGQARRGGGGVPPGQANKGGGSVPPGQANRGGGSVPPGQANRGEGGAPPGRAKEPGRPAAPGNGKQPAKPQPPGQAKGPAADAPKGPARPAPQAHAKDPAPASPPPEQAKDPGSPPPAMDPAKPVPPGQAKEPKAK